MKRHRGFSIVEVMITLIIAIGGMAALTQMQVRLIASGALAKQRAEAGQIAQQRLDLIRAMTFNAVVVGTAPCENFTYSSASALVSSNAKFGVSCSISFYSGTNPPSVVAENLAKFKKVDIAVSWLSNSNEVETIQLSTAVRPNG